MWASFHDLRRHAGFSEADEARVRALAPRLKPIVPEVVRAFLARAADTPGIATMLDRPDRAALLARLEGELAAWVCSVLEMPRDEAYVASRTHIGEAHFRAGLPPHFAVSALTLVRERLVDAVEACADLPGDERRAARHAVMAAIDVDLALILESHRDALLARAARSERLATYGQAVGSIAHELRNPLAVIETSLFLLRQAEPALSEKGLKYADRIERQVRLSSDIIQRLLELVRERPLAKQPVDLAGLAREVVHDLPPPRDVALEVVGAERRVAVQGDPVQLREVLVNLLTNAYEAAVPVGRVRLSLTGGRLSVEDSGAGVSETVAGRLFEPLVTTKQGGTGLGLALVKRIVEQHGGRIEVGRGPLGGATFTVHLEETAR